MTLSSLWLCSGKPTGTFTACSAPSLAHLLEPPSQPFLPHPPDIPSALWSSVVVPKTSAALTLGVEPSWQGPQEQPQPPQGLRCAFFPALIPTPCTGSVSALSWQRFRTQDPARAASMACPAGLGVNGLCVGSAIKIIYVFW